MRFPPNGGNGVRYKVASGGGQRLRPVNPPSRRVLPFLSASIPAQREPLYPTLAPLGVIADLIRNLIRYKDTLPLMRLRVSARNDG